MIAVAIDGPAGAGKSTIARRAAQALSFIYVDTGALYRAVGLYCLEHGASPSVAEEVEPLLLSIQVELAFREGEQRVLLNGEDVSVLIRTPQVSMAASAVSALPRVRAFLFDLQRDIAKKKNVIMDGRDIGTVVLPDAQVKIFLTASPEQRARRRYDEMIAGGQEVSFEEVLEDLIKRDYNDSHRKIAPLMPAPDALLVDTTENTLEQSVEQLINLIKEHLI